MHYSNILSSVDYDINEPTIHYVKLMIKSKKEAAKKVSFLRVQKDYQMRF